MIRELFINFESVDILLYEFFEDESIENLIFYVHSEDFSK
jgi:hypothetical protein